MNVFAHVGLTVAAVYSAEKLLQAWSARRHTREDVRVPALQGQDAKWNNDERPGAAYSIDHRMVLVGSLLPDIIDKPLGLWLAPDLVNHSLRNLGHSGVFVLLLLAGGLVVRWRWRHTAFLVLALSSTGHLLLDQMWHLPRILLWPGRGWEFPVGTTEYSEWWMFHVRHVATDVPEVIGGAALLYVGVMLYRRKAIMRFVRSGAIA